MFKDLKDKIDAELPHGETPPEEVASIRENYPGIPADYLTFLEELGSGEFGPFRLYSSPIEAGPEFPWCAEALEGVILIGDDTLSYPFGYDTKRNFELVELDPDGDLEKMKAATFGEYARAEFKSYLMKE